jgi:crotonobetainyl-CoA:carnitine CoA-transferase CaiB-like acyl-CoA transferase
MLAHPQIRARGYVRDEDGRPVAMNSPFIFARREPLPAPGLGEQTREVLRGIGMGDEEIEELAGRGIVGV